MAGCDHGSVIAGAGFLGLLGDSTVEESFGELALEQSVDILWDAKQFEYMTCDEWPDEHDACDNWESSYYTDRIKQIRLMPYSQYLASPEWKAKRIAHLEHARNRCQLCNGTGGLTVHHRTYDRLGEEEFSDLIVLCRRCHSIFHGRVQLSPPNER